MNKLHSAPPVCLFGTLAGFAKMLLRQIVISPLANFPAKVGI
jgi:hypothetical protein